MAIVPSSTVDTMDLGGLMGATAMSGMAQQIIPPKAEVENRRSDERDATG